MTSERAFDELCGYTLSLHDARFIHQHAVDAFAAQTADESTRPMKLTFALAGLYLHLEKGFTGREVQLAHMRMAKAGRQWPRFKLPRERGSISAADVLAVPEGTERDNAIDAWCSSVWSAYKNDARETLAGLLRQYGIV